jgi:hypothetical protein
MGAFILPVPRNGEFASSLPAISARLYSTQDRETPTATFAELQAFRATAIEMDSRRWPPPALIGWEWWQREIDIFGTFDVTHCRPKDRPNAMPACQNGPTTMTQVTEKIGAGEGNRTLVISLEGWMILRNIRNLATKP